MANFNLQDFLDKPDRMTELLLEMLSDVAWAKPLHSSSEPPALYDAQVYIPISCAAVSPSQRRGYVEAMVRYFHEGTEKVINTALALLPNVIVLPETSQSVEDWAERLIVRIVNEDPRYTPHLEKEWHTTDFDGKKMVFVRAYFSLVPLGENGEPVLVWVVSADAYRYDMTVDPAVYRFVDHIESEVSE